MVDLLSSKEHDICGRLLAYHLELLNPETVTGLVVLHSERYACSSLQAA